FRTPRQETEKLISFLEDLRNSWKPEHASGEAWIEEGQGAGQPVARETQDVEPPENAAQAEMDREAVSSVLIDTEDDLEIEVGDVIRYVDLAKPSDVLTVQITRGKDDFANGIVNESRPLAQALLGAVVGDEVALHLAGSTSKTFQIIEIKRA
ncbi:MAG: GreA/GreB family elongation factor, partial [Brachymonas sp.]